MFLELDDAHVYRPDSGLGVPPDPSLIVVCLLLFARLFASWSWFGFPPPLSYCFFFELFWWELVGSISSVVDLEFSAHLVFVVALSSLVGPVGMFLSCVVQFYRRRFFGSRCRSRSMSFFLVIGCSL